MNDIWTQCRSGRHRDCPHVQRGSDGVLEFCACYCHAPSPDDR